MGDQEILPLDLDAMAREVKRDNVVLSNRAEELLPLGVECGAACILYLFHLEANVFEGLRDGAGIVHRPLQLSARGEIGVFVDADDERNALFSLRGRRQQKAQKQQSDCR